MEGASLQQRRLWFLYRLDPDNSHRQVVPDIGVSNGIGWSPDLRTMYLADSLVAAGRQAPPTNSSA